MNIGVFDSGLGGLTVLREFIAKLPQYHYVYLGDNARAPYGCRSQDAIFEYTCQAVRFLVEKKNCSLIILACNTASSEALRRIQQEVLPKEYPGVRVLGVLIPTAEEAAIVSKKGVIGVVATRGTVESGAYIRELTKLSSSVKIYQEPATLLVPLIEEGYSHNVETKRILKKYLMPLKHAHVDTLILGCTHYPILESDVRRVMGLHVELVSSGKASAVRLVEYLEKHKDILEKLTKDGGQEYYTTDSPERFLELGRRVFHVQIEGVEKVELV